MALYSLHPTLARISFLTNIELGTDRAEYPGHSGTDFSWKTWHCRLSARPGFVKGENSETTALTIWGWFGLGPSWNLLLTILTLQSSGIGDVGCSKGLWGLQWGEVSINQIKTEVVNVTLCLSTLTESRPPLRTKSLYRYSPPRSEQ